MRHLFFVMLTVAGSISFFGCRHGENKSETTPADGQRYSASVNTKDEASIQVCRDVMLPSMKRGVAALNRLNAQSVQSGGYDALAAQYKIECVPKIPNDSIYQIDRSKKVLYVDSEFRGLLKLTESPYARENYELFNVDQRLLTMNRFMTALSAAIVLDEAGELNGDYRIFYKVLKLLESVQF